MSNNQRHKRRRFFFKLQCVAQICIYRTYIERTDYLLQKELATDEMACQILNFDFELFHDKNYILDYVRMWRTCDDEILVQLASKRSVRLHKVVVTESILIYRLEALQLLNL